jgi:alpha-beta hydrolase superfamily lysophospholipase
MGEHAARYWRFAEFLADNGYAVYANDHRGHGRTAGDLQKAGLLGPGGWNGAVNDLYKLSIIIMQENPAPLFLLGHIWGSFLVQDYIHKWGRILQGAILSGNSGKESLLSTALIIATRSIEKEGPEEPAHKLYKRTFNRWNRQFHPNRTQFDWLTRDEPEVDNYIQDPWCGWSVPNEFFFELVKGLRQIWIEADDGDLPKDLPLFIFSGSEDPVGQYQRGKSSNETLQEGGNHGS